MARKRSGRIRRNQPSGEDRPNKPRRRRPVKREAPQFDDLSLVPSDLLVRAAQHKLVWIQAWVNAGCPRGRIEAYAERAKVALGLDEPVPPYTTLKTWADRYGKHGILGLIDRVPSHAGTSYALDEDSKLLLRVAVIGGKKSITTARGFLIEQLSGQPRRSTKKVASYNTCLREVHRLRREEPHLFAMAQQGPTYFRNVYRLAIAQGALPAGYRYEIDSTVADIWVRVPHPAEVGKWIAVRPVLTVVQDAGSRGLLAFNLALSAVDSGIILGTIQRAIDKDYNYPGLISLGLPFEVAVDQGAENRGVFLHTMQNLGITVLYGIPNEPQGRAKVERLIKTITTEVFAHMIGYSPTHKRLDPYAPADADAKRTLTSLKYESMKIEVQPEQLSTLPELEARILAWGSVYNDRPHAGLPSDSPELRRLIELARRSDDASQDSNSEEAA